MTDFLGQISKGLEIGEHIAQRPQRDALAQLGIERQQQALQAQQAQQQRAGTEFDQGQALQRAKILNQSASALKRLPFEQRDSAFERLRPRLEQFGIDVGQLEGGTLTDQLLDQAIASTQGFLSDPSSTMTEFQRQNLEIQRQRLEQQREPTPAQREKLELQRLRLDPSHQKALKEAEERGKLQAKLDLGLEYERESALVKNEVAKMISQQGQATKLPDVDNVLSILLPDDSIDVLDKIYGKGEALYPDALRSQQGLDALAARDQLVSMLQLGARGELKGQGPITEGEQDILSRAATMLGNPSISPELAKTQVKRAVEILRTSAGKAQPAQPTTGNVGRFKVEVVN